MTAARGSCFGQVDRRRAERAGDLEPLGDAVDGDDLGGARGAGHLDGAEPDRTEPEHDGGVTGHQAPVRHGVEPGAHHVPGEQRGVAGQAVGHPAQDQVGLGDEDLLGLRAGERSQRGAVAEHAGLVALVEVAAQAEEAVAAGGVEAAEDAVADADPVDALSRGDHGAHELVADHEAGLDLHPAVVDVEVRAADAGGLDGDDRVVVGQKLGLGHVVDTDLAGSLEGDGLHGPHPTQRGELPLGVEPAGWPGESGERDTFGI